MYTLLILWGLSLAGSVVYANRAVQLRVLGGPGGRAGGGTTRSVHAFCFGADVFFVFLMKRRPCILEA